MTPDAEFLDPRAKLVDATADWLAARVRTDPSGAASLAHVCVVVPTAQGGRNLRLALAKRFENGLVPPAVVQPMRLVAPADESLPDATDVEVAALFLRFAQTRPRRHAEGGNTVVPDEWTHLFRPDSFEDPEDLFAVLDQLSDLWNVLGAGGLLLRDVPENAAAKEILARAQGDESVRWDELADLETAFFAFLHDHGLRHRAESIRLAKSAPKPLPAETEEVVLPALLDPVPVLCDALARQRGSLRVTVLLHCAEADRDRFDAWGRPKTDCWTGARRPVLDGLSDADVVCTATDAGLAEAVAASFPAASEGLEVPALGLCDDALFADLAAALSAKGYALHNPARFRLGASSLGRIADRLVSLHAGGGATWPWDAFASLLREDDVLRRVADGPGRPARTDVLAGLDACANALFPVAVPRDGRIETDRMDPEDGHKVRERALAREFAKAARALADLLRGAGRGAPDAASFLRRALADLYAERAPGRGPGDDEFAAALDALRGVLAQLDCEAVRSPDLAPPLRTALLRRALSNAAYSLEPDSARILTTDGWLELAWSGKDRIVLAGFEEGAVPETVAGHVFLPDSLRAALGLPSNESRLARDTVLLKELLDARAGRPGSVRAFFPRTDAEGDIHRPSRLLFLVRDADLPRRVGTLFGAPPDAGRRPPRRVAPQWRPRLSLDPVPLPGADEGNPDGALSASTVDEWLRCPFAWFLRHGMKMRRFEPKAEPGADDFGTFVHKVLERYAREQLDRTRAGRPQLADEREIADALRRLCRDEGGRLFGDAPPLKVRLQLDAAERRLGTFARIQAGWAADGWRVAAEPEFAFRVRPFEGEGAADAPVRGSVDRIDGRPGPDGKTEYRLVDFKTWDDRAKASGHVVKGGGEQVEHARTLRLPLVEETNADGSPKPPRRFLTVQLPLYGRCLEKHDPATFVRDGRIADFLYVVLGTSDRTSGTFGGALPDGGRRPDARTFRLAEHAREALDTARAAIRRIREGVFWPPGPGDELRYDLKDVFLDSPQKDLDGTDWLREQERRLARIAMDGSEGTEAAP